MGIFPLPLNSLPREKFIFDRETGDSDTMPKWIQKQTHHLQFFSCPSPGLAQSSPSRTLWRVYRTSDPRLCLDVCCNMKPHSYKYREWFVGSSALGGVEDDEVGIVVGRVVGTWVTGYDDPVDDDSDHGSVRSPLFVESHVLAV